MCIWPKETTGGHWSGVWGKNGESGRPEETQRWEAGVRVGGIEVMGGGLVRKRWASAERWLV